MTLNKKPSNRTKQQFKGFAIVPYYPDWQKKYGVVYLTITLKPY